MLRNRSLQFVCLGALALSSSFAFAAAGHSPQPSAEFFSQAGITKTAVPTTFTVGAPAEYDIVVSNAGTATTPASGIVVTDPLPAGVTFNSASGSDWSCTGTPLVCTYGVVVLAGAVSSTLVLNVTIAPGTTVADNTATLSVSDSDDENCPSGVPTPDAQCLASVSVGVVQPDLDISKTASPAIFVPGQAASYTILVTNNGNGNAPVGEQITDTLPAGVTLAGYTGTIWSCNTVGQTLTCTISEGLSTGTNSGPLTLNVNVAPGTLNANNSATVETGDPTCPAAAHCTASVLVPVQQPAPAVLPANAAWALLLLALALAFSTVTYLKKRQG